MTSALAQKSFLGSTLRPVAPTQGKGTRQVTRAAVEFYGPERAKWLGPFSENATPDYLTGEFAGDSLGHSRSLS